MSTMMNLEICTGLRETSPEEDLQTSGGFLPLLLIAGGALLAYNRINGSNSQSNHKSTQINVNCNDCRIYISPDINKP